MGVVKTVKLRKTVNKKNKIQLRDQETRTEIQ